MKLGGGGSTRRVQRLVELAASRGACREPALATECSGEFGVTPGRDIVVGNSGILHSSRSIR